MIYKVYKASSNGKIYIGRTSLELRKRINYHKYFLDSKRGTKISELSKDIEDIDFEIIHTTNSKNASIDLEMCEIAMHKALNLNIVNARKTDRLSKFSMKKKIENAEARKKFYRDIKIQKKLLPHGLIGYKASIEKKKRMSEARLKRSKTITIYKEDTIVFHGKNQERAGKSIGCSRKTISRNMNKTYKCYLIIGGSSVD